MAGEQSWHEPDSAGRFRREQRLHELPKLLRAERLWKVAIDADLFGTFSLDGLIRSRKKHDLRARKPRILANAAADLYAVDAARQHEIEEDKVGLALLTGFERARAIYSFDEIVVGISERERNELPQIGLIIDDQN